MRLREPEVNFIVIIRGVWFVERDCRMESDNLGRSICGRCLKAHFCTKLLKEGLVSLFFRVFPKEKINPLSKAQLKMTIKCRINVTNDVWCEWRGQNKRKKKRRLRELSKKKGEKHEREMSEGFWERGEWREAA